MNWFVSIQGPWLDDTPIMQFPVTLVTHWTEHLLELLAHIHILFSGLCNIHMVVVDHTVVYRLVISAGQEK